MDGADEEDLSEDLRGLPFDRSIPDELRVIDDLELSNEVVRGNGDLAEGSAGG
jgi:hypothetical protein